MGRREVELPAGPEYSKVEQRIVDFDNLDNYGKDFENITKVREPGNRLGSLGTVYGTWEPFREPENRLGS